MTSLNLEILKDFLNKTKSLIDYHDGPISTISYYIQSYLYNVMSRKILKYQFPEQELMKFLQVTMIISCSFLNQLHKKKEIKNY